MGKKAAVEKTISGGRMVFRTVIRGSVQQVWDEVTRTDGVNTAFFCAVMEMQGRSPGDALAMRTKNGKYTSVVGEVTEWDPPRRFAHTMRFTHLDEAPVLAAYELEEVDGGTQFTLIVEGATPGTKSYKGMAGGGTMICNLLRAAVERGRAPLWFRAFLPLVTMMMTKRQRSEHWALGSWKKEA